MFKPSFKSIGSFFLCVLFSIQFQAYAQRNIQELDRWSFSKGDDVAASTYHYDDSKWEKVSVPHDWSIYGPFDESIDRQNVRIIQNNEDKATEKTGRTGALPFIGVGWYRTTLTLSEANSKKQNLITFDGAMSNARVFVNGVKVGYRPYGYSYFYFDISQYVKAGENKIAVRLENKPFSSRWYPGAGIYRKVQLITKEKESFKHWGHYLTTPSVSESSATVNIISKFVGKGMTIKTLIKDAKGKVVAQAEQKGVSQNITQSIEVQQPRLWSPATPYLYTAELQLYEGENLKDSEQIRFGIRSLKYSPEKGFELNGKVTKFKGVCLHHDLGPIGIALNKAALRRQLTILKEMGCNAIRSSHNMPSIEQLELCDEMGFLFLAESFDEWKKGKVENGYNLYFEKWAEKDIVNLVQATRNHPCIVMWSSGNEVPDQRTHDGVKRAQWLQDIFHREDPTRPVTVGMDKVKSVMENGFASVLDIPGLNYRVHLYEEANKTFPQGFLLGSETASTVSSRGVYKFPVELGIKKTYPDGQCSSYDLEYCSWSNIPEDDFIMQDDKDWVIGEFVWTGFDYLGEPTPYDTYWPARSSYFGICDLAGIPKDRYYLYRSRWNKEKETLHILPHWNWKGRENQKTPVFVYTNYESAELFVNGKSQGVRTKSKDSKLDRYRLRWMDVNYEPGELKVVAFDAAGKAVAEKKLVTAGDAYTIKLEADRKKIKANGQDLSYVTATIVDKKGNPCPLADHQLQFEVSGAAKYRAACSGDATSLEQFHLPQMKAFNGKLVILVQSTNETGKITLNVSADGLKKAKIVLSSSL